MNVDDTQRLVPLLPPPVPTAPPPISGLAVASVLLAVLGIVSGFCTFGIPALLAVILGHVALADTRDGTKSGHGVAVAGTVMGYVVVVPALLFSLWVLFGGGMTVLAGG